MGWLVLFAASVVLFMTLERAGRVGLVSSAIVQELDERRKWEGVATRPLPIVPGDVLTPPWSGEGVDVIDS